MAVRPVFMPSYFPPFYTSRNVSFSWFPGMAKPQKRKSIRSLHDATKSVCGISRILEVSSNSELHLGVTLSAFSLQLHHPKLGQIPMESGFQGSKVFKVAGQMEAAYQLSPREAKSLAKETDAIDELVGFIWQDRSWPLEPKSWFYDWLYISAVLESQPRLTDRLRAFEGFTDIEFNPTKSFNCQARSCAIIASTANDAQIKEFISHPQTMIRNPDDSGTGQAAQRVLF